MIVLSEYIFRIQGRKIVTADVGGSTGIPVGEYHARTSKYSSSARAVDIAINDKLFDF